VAAAPAGSRTAGACRTTGCRAADPGHRTADRRGSGRRRPARTDGGRGRRLSGGRTVRGIPSRCRHGGGGGWRGAHRRPAGAGPRTAPGPGTVAAPDPRRPGRAAAPQVPPRTTTASGNSVMIRLLGLLLLLIPLLGNPARAAEDRKSTRLNSSHVKISYAVF